MKNYDLCNFLAKDTFDRLAKYIGNPNILFQHKSIYTALVFSPNDRNLSIEEIDSSYIIIMNKSTPLFVDDKFFYMWIRHSSPTMFRTGASLKEQEQWPMGRPNFGSYDDIDRFTRNYGTQQEIRQEQFIISQNLSEKDIFNLNSLKEQDIEKIIFRTPLMKEIQDENQSLIIIDSVLDFYQQNNIRIEEHCSSVRSAYIKTLQTAKRYPVINDLGPQKLDECIDLLDVMVITIYRGNLESAHIGGEMPKFKTILQKFSVIFVSEELPQHEGFIKFYVLLRNDLI